MTTTDRSPGPALTVSEGDSELDGRLTEALIAFNSAATGASDRGAFSIKVTDEAGELVGGLTARTWGGLCGIELLWVREDSRKGGWGSRILQAAEAEARRRGCDRLSTSTATFQAPGFYLRHGFVETGRTPGVPGGHADVHLFKSLADSPSAYAS
ncbi:GNAT family N-acetyltransferase [Streptomyces sp. NPDC053493]|uniref:GNAT family N-acetyltransferase n=1 Tax=Streptomyces sp. NPDC053493 TaxID=3365705 RepID=UPI0037CE1328